MFSLSRCGLSSNSTLQISARAIGTVTGQDTTEKPAKTTSEKGRGFGDFVPLPGRPGKGVVIFKDYEASRVHRPQSFIPPRKF